MVAPMAMQKMAHPDGERGTMGAADANGMGMVWRVMSIRWCCMQSWV